MTPSYNVKSKEWDKTLNNLISNLYSYIGYVLLMSEIILYLYPTTHSNFYNYTEGSQPC